MTPKKREKRNFKTQKEYRDPRNLFRDQVKAEEFPSQVLWLSM